MIKDDLRKIQSQKKKKKLQSHLTWHKDENIWN